jgi:hypothetical protein
MDLPATWIEGNDRTRLVDARRGGEADVESAMTEYDRLGQKQFFAEHGFAPATTYELVWEEHTYPPKAILGTTDELATGRRLASGEFEGGKAGAVKLLGRLGFTVRPLRR